MKRISWKVWMGLLLVFLSAFFYVIHYVIFRDAHHIFIYLVGDIAFVPLEVLLVTLIIERLLHEREKQSLLKKLNMLIGAFYSEVGTPLMKYFMSFMTNEADHFIVSAGWSEKDFNNAMQYVRSIEHVIDSQQGDLRGLKDFLVKERVFLLGLLENPNLLEHESFTDLLFAVFHLTEELTSREDLQGLPKSDLEHLAGDMKRAYSQLMAEWLTYMKYLKKGYPYLFSLSVRTNPFNRDASPIVR
jgi:hypothetical protein